ncbi:DUF4397 domain-containing protein [Pedobacter sp. BS3]|uniref:DUF4397 domain-containing protein n=1 Tax=Pedobacter sp. BS3 TaxID=2567937 RepID=UPI0011EFB64D|nr:DUF4397 domain-containing protein [Pedobacter sp. BS3]TZF82184.1 DUF4397 domain-containing protein [Pedobacter sp. BS3]
MKVADLHGIFWGAKPVLKTGRVLYGLLLIAIFGTGCSKDELSGAKITTAIMTVNAASNFPDMNFYLADLQGQQINPDGAVQYPGNSEYITPYQDNFRFGIQIPGESDFHVLDTTGQRTDTLGFAGGKYYTIFAVRRSAAASSADSIRVIITADDLSAPVTGKAKLRFINLTPDAPGIDVVARDSSTLFRNQTFGNMSSFITLSPKTSLILELHETGKTDIKLTLPALVIQPDKIYTLWSRGLWSSTTGTTALGLNVITNK